MSSAASPRSAGTYIKHVVIVIQENRSFDNFFEGFAGANTQPYGYTHSGAKVALQQGTYTGPDIAHFYSTAVADIDKGKMDGFDQNAVGSGTAGAYAYTYVPRSVIAPYWTMAQRYVLADHMFPTMLGPSFTAHLSLIAGTANLSPTVSEVDLPSNSSHWGCDAPAGTSTETISSSFVYNDHGPAPCFTQFRTMADTLDAAGISWKYYAPAIGSSDGGQIWSAFDAISKVRYGTDWASHVIAPPQQILVDASHGTLPAVSWVAPDFYWSDHLYQGSNTTPYGPSWVAQIANSIGATSLWKSTAIVVVWDDWGGFYDNVAPPQYDYRGLGIRVGCIIVSPYVHPHVSHTVYEFGSILKFVEQTFGLPYIGLTSNGYTDSRANSILDSFDFTMTPRTFTAIPAPYPASYFINHKPSFRAPDEY